MADESVLAVVTARKQHSVNYHQRYFMGLAGWYDMWRGVYTTRSSGSRNSVHFPLLFSIVESDVARKVQTSFGAWPVVTFSGYAPEDAGKARKNEVLISAQMKDAESFVKAVDFFVTADLYGMAVARLGWRTDRRLEPRRVMNPITRGMERGTEEVVRFDGPDWDVVDPLDFWPQPGKRRIRDMDWCIHRYYLELDAVREMAQAGVFDSAALKDLEAAPMTTETSNEMGQRLSVYRSYGEFQARREEKYAKPIEIWDMWGRLPSDFVTDGMPHRVVTVANGRAILRNKPNPFWHGRLPFYEYSPCPDPHYFHGVGKIEIGQKMQATANRLGNQKLDALDLVVYPTWLMDRSLGIDTQDMYLSAGRVLGTDKAPVPDLIRPLSPDLRGLEHAYPEIAQLWAMIQQGTGLIEDTVMGAQGQRQTAREYLGRQESAITRLMLESRLAEEGFVEPLANGFVDLNKQFLSVPKEVKILGSASTVNPVTGLPYPPEPVTVGLEDINHNFRAQAVGSTQMLGKSVRQQNMMLALQAVSQNPVAIKMVNWAAFFRQFFQTLDLTNLDELLVQNVPMVNQMADESGMAPAQMAGLLTQEPMPQMNPESLGAIVGQNGAPLMGFPPLMAHQGG
jgi:hypothetical protein